MRKEKREKRNEKWERALDRFSLGFFSGSLCPFLVALFSLFLLTASGCAWLNPWAQQEEEARQTQLAAARANAAADHAERSAAAAEQAARQATIAADRVEKVVRADSQAIDADSARINYLIAQRERRRHHHRSHIHHHHVTAAPAPPPASSHPNMSSKAPPPPPPYGTE
jgi:uncharacterized iron-regulated membrane protein